MDALWTIVGVAIIAVGLVDLFLAVLQHDAIGFLTPVLYRWSWVLGRTATAPLPGRMRGRVRSLIAPGMVVLTLMVWLGTQLAGFALVFYPGLTDHGFVLGSHLPRSFGTALTLSAASLASVSFNDLHPRSLAYHGLAAAETLVGLGVLTLTISYVLNVYRVLQDQSGLATALHHQAEDGGDPRSILAPHFVDGSAVGLSTHLREFHRSLVGQSEGMRRYPIVYYFQSRAPYRSIPYIFHMIGGVVAALRWGLPAGHPATRDPWLPALTTGYWSTMRSIERHFVPPAGPADPTPVAFEPFAEACMGRELDVDPRVGEFVELDRFMRALAGIRTLPDAEEAYDRYRGWLPFACESRAFVSAMARDLGIDPASLVSDPDASRY